MKVYLDNAATTSVHLKVTEKIIYLLRNDYGNPSSIHSFGRKNRVLVEEAREIIANFINADASEIYFTSGGTESDNFIINGISLVNFQETNRNKIITFDSEHHAVLDPIKNLSEFGLEPVICKSNQDSTFNFNALAAQTDDRTSLISCMLVNNETGAINDLKKISSEFKNTDLYIHTDAVQAFTKIKIDVKELGIDALSISGHKIHALKGVGAAYIKNCTPMKPMILGGSQERNRRGGTENIIGIAALAEAIKIARGEMIDFNDHILSLRNYFIKGIQQLAGNSIEINSATNQLPHILSITFKSEFYNNDSESMLIYLDLNGIAASGGAACSSGTLKPSHVILSMGKSHEDAKGTIRFSFGYENTIAEIDYTLQIISELIKKFSK